jgi:Lar family restriction alleviation protein
MDMSDNSKLKPCPFCGEVDIEVERVGTNRASCIVACTNCGVRIESGETGFGDVWNTRATSSDAMPLFTRKCDERIAELEKELKNYKEMYKELMLNDEAELKAALEQAQ